MFYFKHANEDGFFIGMTPLGVAALNKGFAPLKGYRHVPYGGR
jgi:hypothetical protein